MSFISIALTSDLGIKAIVFSIMLAGCRLAAERLSAIVGVTPGARSLTVSSAVGVGSLAYFT